jgi:Flp pilus assembly protein TadB
MTDHSRWRRLLTALLRLAGADERYRRARAVGDIPRLVGRFALRVRVEPTPEAVAAAGTAVEGPLADRLASHVRSATGRETTGLETFAAAVADEHPGLSRAVQQVVAATEAPAAERERRLDRATETAVAAVRERAATAAASLRGPVTAVYAFGVLLPLALVGVLPAVATAGVPGPTLLLAVALGYNLVLPAGLLVAAGWLLARRPVAFPSEPVPRSHPERPDGYRRGVAAGAAAALSAAAAVLLVPGVPRWTAPVAAVGAAGIGLVVHFRPAVRVRERTAAIEAGLPDALVAVGHEVAAGVAVERAVANAADSLGDPVGPLFASAADRGRRLGCGVPASLRGAAGPVASLPSPRVDAAVDALATAAREGPPAGSLLVETGEHLAQLRRMTERTRRETAQLTATLTNTAAVFGPLVGGATVALAGGTAMDVTTGSATAGADISASAATVGSPLPVAGLGLAVGAYVLWLAAVVTALATGLRYGPDRTRIGYRIGLALPLAAVTFCLAVVVGGLVV